MNPLSTTTRLASRAWAATRRFWKKPLVVIAANIALGVVSSVVGSFVLSPLPGVCLGIGVAIFSAFLFSPKVERIIVERIISLPQPPPELLRAALKLQQILNSQPDESIFPREPPPPRKKKGS